MGNTQNGRPKKMLFCLRSPSRPSPPLFSLLTLPLSKNRHKKPNLLLSFHFSLQSPLSFLLPLSCAVPSPCLAPPLLSRLLGSCCCVNSSHPISCLFLHSHTMFHFQSRVRNSSHSFIFFIDYSIRPILCGCLCSCLCVCCHD